MSRRTAKVEELLREEISRLIQSEMPEDFGIISVTRTAVTPDLKLAKIYVSALFIEKEKEIIKALNLKAKEFQKILAGKLPIRYMPRIIFEFDKARHEIDRVEELLEEIEHGS